MNIIAKLKRPIGWFKQLNVNAKIAVIALFVTTTALGLNLLFNSNFRRWIGFDSFDSLSATAAQATTSDSVNTFLERRSQLFPKDSILWYEELDLIGGGKKNDFYFITLKDSSDIILDVFATNDFGIENVYHDVLSIEPDILGEFAIDPLRLGGRDVFISYSKEGSGKYLYFKLLTYPGYGKLQQVYEEEGVPDGQFVPRDGKLYVRGGSKTYELSLHEGKIKKQYLQTKPELTAGTHVLSIAHIDKDLKLQYDYKNLRFKTNGEKLISDSEFTIRITEQIIWDKNTTDKGSHDIRLFGRMPLSSSFNITNGISNIILTPKVAGRETLYVDIDYNGWLGVPLRIVP